MKMKMKKLLSIGAIGLVLASSISVGASAATVPSKTELLVSILTNQYTKGVNQTGLLTGVNKDTKIGTIVSDSVINKVNTDLGSSSTVDKTLTKFENNKDNTVAAVLAKSTSDKATFEKFQTYFVTIATKIEDMDGITDPTLRTNSENEVIALLSAYNQNLSIKFGKDSEGKTTGTIYKGRTSNNNGTMLIQLNTSDIESAINTVQGVTWDEVSTLKATY
jgi:hypothetical protein